MKIVSWNVNGLRSVHPKGLFDFLRREKPEIICFQEIKVAKADLPRELVNPLGYTSFFCSARRKGYAGTAVYTKIQPNKLVKKTGFERLDQEGRFLLLEFPGLTLVNLYLPHGGRAKENLPYKFSCYRALFRILNGKIPDILIGDFNIAHTELDLANPRQNEDNTMFTKKEREQLDRVLSFGYRDSFRIFTKEGGHYSWWPFRNNLRQRNIGWRIDYAFATSKFAAKIKKAFILKKVFGSDHCPIGIEI